MRQYHLDSAIARATGESLRTIQQRGFGLVRMNSDRSQRRVSVSAPASAQVGHAEQVADDFAQCDSNR